MPPTEPKKVVFCVPTLTRPYQPMLDALEASMPSIEEAGWESGMVSEIGCPYISSARATMLRKALDAKATHIVFLDHDVSWEPRAIMRLLTTEGDVVAGIYRFKEEPEKYMGTVIGEYPTVRKDGCIQMANVPAGFLRITRHVVNAMIKTHPELCYGEPCHPGFDLFNHGAHEGVWWGEDYAFCRRWTAMGGEIWCIPDLNIDHHTTDRAYPGNFHQFMLKQPGGSESEKPFPPHLRVVA